MSPTTARHRVTKELGRRVSKGEYERIFSTLHRVPLKTTKVVYRQKDGKSDRIVYHPVMIVMNDHSPKFARKHGDTVGQKKSRRARTEYAFAAK